MASQGDNNPFAADPLADSNATKPAAYASFTKASAVLPPVGFKSASALSIQNMDNSRRSPSPEVIVQRLQKTWCAMSFIFCVSHTNLFYLRNEYIGCQIALLAVDRYFLDIAPPAAKTIYISFDHLRTITTAYRRDS
jgi:hypothetical protein